MQAQAPTAPQPHLYGSRSTASSSERVKPEWVNTTMTCSASVKDTANCQGI